MLYRRRRCLLQDERNYKTRNYRRLAQSNCTAVTAVVNISSVVNSSSDRVSNARVVVVVADLIDDVPYNCQTRPKTVIQMKHNY